MDDALFAAVDLGSNSFRLSVARMVCGQEAHGMPPRIQTTERLKDAVRLAAGLDADNTLAAPEVARAVAVLKRYGDRLRGFDPARVRAVATNTFRVARNTGAVLQQAQAALGFPIEVISGEEVARLIYAGVSGELPPSNTPRLVMDIGGGSTEVILGRGAAPLHLASLGLGCVAHTRRFFPDGRLTARRFDQARLAALREFEAIAPAYRRTGWFDAYGSSGTAKGLNAILREGGLIGDITTDDTAAGGMTARGLLALQERLVQEGQVIPEHLPGIKPARAPVLAGGLAIMLAAFDALKIDRMLTGDGALRAGVLRSLLARSRVGDTPARTVSC